MGLDVQQIPGTSQATPLSNDVIRELQGFLDKNSLGTGVSDLQREAGSATRQLISSGLDRVASGGVSQGTTALLDAITKRSNINTNKQAADLRESFGITGNRFGSSLARGEGELRANAGSALDQTLADVLVGERRFDVESLLAAINSASQQGLANMEPFLRIAGLGILPTDNIVSPSIGQQLLSGIIRAGGNVAAAKAGVSTIGG